MMRFADAGSSSPRARAAEDSSSVSAPSASSRIVPIARLLFRVDSCASRFALPPGQRFGGRTPAHADYTRPVPAQATFAHKRGVESRASAFARAAGLAARPPLLQG